MNLSIKVDLIKLKDATLTTLTGKTGVKKSCLIIPIEGSGLFVGEKGVYLNLSAFEIREPKFDQTHLVKLSMDKVEYDALTEDQKKALPILGGLKPIKSNAMQPEAEELIVVPGEGGADLPF